MATHCKAYVSQYQASGATNSYQLQFAWK